MKSHSYAPADAKALSLLLDSIGRELEERGDRLEQLEARIEDLNNRPFSCEEELRVLVAEAALNRHEMRLCRLELERLGCSVLGTMPLTIRIPTQVGAKKRSLVWQHGQDPDD